MQEQVVIASQEFFDNIQVLSDFVRNLQDKENNDNDLLSVDEACNISKMGKTKIYSMVNSGQIEHKRFGNSIRILKSSLLQVAS